MALYTNAEQKKEILRNFIRNNPNTTHKEIRKKLHIKTEKVYTGGMAEAFMDAGIKPPRTFEMKNKEKRKKILIDYLRKHPNIGMHIVNRETKINYLSVFKDVKQFYLEAELDYTKNKRRNLLLRTKENKKKLICDLIKQNPLISIDKVAKITNTQPYHLFKNTREIYSLAGIDFINKGNKKRINKQNKVIDYIKNNPLATQRQINHDCKTHVQLIFNKGIFEAYERAGVSYPYERIPLHRVALKDIRNKAENFEAEIASKLSGYGTITRLVKTKRGYADIIIERKNNKAIVEVKDYLVHEISISQIKQLNKYLEDFNCNLGFLVCHKKPLKDKFLIGENSIYILTSDELNKIPEVIDGSVV